MLKMETAWSPNRVQKCSQKCYDKQEKNQTSISLNQFKNFINFLLGLCQDIHIALIKAVRCIAFCNIIPWDQHHINS